MVTFLSIISTMPLSALDIALNFLLLLLTSQIKTFSPLNSHFFSYYVAWPFLITKLLALFLFFITFFHIFLHVNLLIVVFFKTDCIWILVPPFMWKLGNLFKLFASLASHLWSEVNNIHFLVFLYILNESIYIKHCLAMADAILWVHYPRNPWVPCHGGKLHSPVPLESRWGHKTTFHQWNVTEVICHL